jgi:hypothetical protein
LDSRTFFSKLVELTRLRFTRNQEVWITFRVLLGRQQAEVTEILDEAAATRGR